VIPLDFDIGYRVRKFGFWENIFISVTTSRVSNYTAFHTSDWMRFCHIPFKFKLANKVNLVELQSIRSRNYLFKGYLICLSKSFLISSKIALMYSSFSPPLSLRWSVKAKISLVFYSSLSSARLSVRNAYLIFIGKLISSIISVNFL
jgi:hypothetical protein